MITLTIPPSPSTLPGPWKQVAVAFGVSSAGVTLSITPVTTPTPTPPIQILPTFSGLGSSAGAAEALLLQVLDAVVTAIGPSTVSDPHARCRGGAQHLRQPSAVLQRTPTR